MYMYALKIILIGVAVLVMALLLIALFVRKNYEVEREITINQPSQKIFDYVKYLKNQDHYSKWNMIDPGMQQTYSGTDGSVGFKSAWDSQNKQAGKGEQQITGLTDGKRMDVAIHFIRPFEGDAEASIFTDAVTGNQTKVRWTLKSGMKYPMNLLLLVMNMDKIIGDDLAANLSNLKVVMEK